jgi:hypothetical protein
MVGLVNQVQYEAKEAKEAKESRVTFRLGRRVSSFRADGASAFICTVLLAQET